MRIGLVGTFPPRACGIATFTADVAAALELAGHDVDVVALVDGPHDDGATAARHHLDRRDPAASRSMADVLSATVDVVLVQHEYGIFGGPDGGELSLLTERLHVPFAITLHTVSGRPTASQRAALDPSLDRAAAILVFTDEAAELIADGRPDRSGRCQVVPHGAPTELYRGADDSTRQRLGLPDDATVLTTFGLLSPGKGIEHAIRAVASLRNAIDGLVYVVAGRTHPEVVRRHGEDYRRHLTALVDRLGLRDVVVFRDWFHDVPALADLLAGTDVFVTPYTGAEQIVSGALSFAVAAGLPFVSTPYRYAEDLARRGCGLTVPFDRPDELAASLKELLTDGAVRAQLSARSHAVGASMAWPFVGRRTADVLASIASQ
ncbi:MAG: glycosyltransferase [Ilumatobacteraceae bacterium]